MKNLLVVVVLLFVPLLICCSDTDDSTSLEKDGKESFDHLGNLTFNLLLNEGKWDANPGYKDGSVHYDTYEDGKEVFKKDIDLLQ